MFLHNHKHQGNCLATHAHILLKVLSDWTRNLLLLIGLEAYKSRLVIFWSLVHSSPILGLALKSRTKKDNMATEFVGHKNWYLVTTSEKDN